MCVLNGVNMFVSYFVYKENPILFIHIPKTGGASLLRGFSNAYHGNVNVVTNNRTRWSNYHSTLQDFEDWLCPLETPKIFTFVRNPWARAVSWYFFRKEVLRQGLKSLSANKPSKKIQNLKASMKEYRCMEKGFYAWLERYNEKVWDYTWFSLSTTQSTWIKSSTYNIDNIIKLEEIHNHFYKIDYLKEVKLPHINKSASSERDWKSMYNGASRDIIKNLYEEDIDVFKYTF
jgi:hypothetical protein